MKRITFLLTIALMGACVCLPQEIPVQIVYADSNCQGVLPDYLPGIMVRDNCDESVLTQDPEAGTILNGGVLYEVRITAVDISGNKDSVWFDVYVMDVTPPEIILPDSMLSEEIPFELLDEFQTSLYPYISDSIRDTHNLVMISTPNFRHVGGYYQPNFMMVPLTEEDLEAMGWLPTWSIDAGSPTDDWYNMTTGGTASRDYMGIDTMYLTERWGDFNYSIPIGVGSFTVELHFMEIVFTEPKERIFSVELEGEMVITNLDIIQEVGYTESLVKTFPVEVDGYLDIDFIPVHQNPKISGIKIYKSQIAGI